MPLNIIIVPPINIFIFGTSFKIKYAKIIPKIIMEYLNVEVIDKGAVTTDL